MFQKASDEVLEVAFAEVNCDNEKTIKEEQNLPKVPFIILFRYIIVVIAEAYIY
jgi:hypothetical protein